MRSSLPAVGLVFLLALVARAADKEMRVKGTLRSGVVAIGGETTGTVVETKEGNYELDLGKNEVLRRKAEKLDGRAVVVTGTLTVREGVEDKQRRIITVSSLKAADEK